MKRTKTRWLLAGVLCLALLPPTTHAQDTKWEKSNAAGVEAYQQGRYGEAEKRWLAALEEAESFGPDDQRLGTSLNNLGVLYQARGKYAEAEPLFKRSLAIREKALGAEHPDVIQSLNNVAGFYYNQGKYAEAEPLYKHLLAILGKFLGPEHPNVALMLENYALLLRKMNRDAEAEKMEARAKAIRAKHAQENPPKQRLPRRPAADEFSGVNSPALARGYARH